MKMTLISSEKIPISATQKGPINTAIYEIALSISPPKPTVISPLSKTLKNTKRNLSNIFYYVDIEAQKNNIRSSFDNKLPPGLQNSQSQNYFAYLNGVTDLLVELDPDIIQVHNRVKFIPYLLRHFPDKRILLYLHTEPQYANPQFPEIVNGVDHLIFSDQSLASRFTSHFPESQSKTTIIQNSVEQTQHFYDQLTKNHPRALIAPNKKSKSLTVTMVNAEKLPVPPVLGGAVEHTLYETATMLKNPRFSVISPWSKALQNAPEYDSKKFFHVNIKTQKRHFPSQKNNRSFIGVNDKDALKMVHYLKGVSHHLSKIDSDVIQIHNRLEFAPTILKQFPHKKIAIWFHNEPTTYAVCPKRVVHKVDHFVFVSHFLERKFRLHYSIPTSKTTVIHNGLNINHWHPRLRHHPKTKKIRQKYNLVQGQTILFVGRTSAQKGIHYLLDAMPKVLEKEPNAKLLIVGSPFFGAVSQDPFTRRLIKQAKNIGKAIQFSGYIDRAELPYFFAAADVTTVPSLFQDPLPKVVLESMATGIPVIASRRGGIPEMIDDGQNGLLINSPRETAALSAQILTLLKDKTLRHTLGKAARLKVEQHFTSEIRHKKLQTFYHELMHQNNTPI
ncbi:MAG: spore coat protein SA [Candidatus Latescibacterota bacterium]|jgi:spore coat protein SA